MNDFTDKDCSGPGPPRPHWPLDLMKSLGEERRYFSPPKGLGVQSGAELEALFLAASAPEACARGLALVQALQLADFVGTKGDGDSARDLYAARYAGRRLQLALSPYRFAGRPAILLVVITALAAAEAT